MKLPCFYVTIDIAENRQSIIREIVVEGNDKTSENLIRRAGAFFSMGHRTLTVLRFSCFTRRMCVRCPLDNRFGFAFVILTVSLVLPVLSVIGHNSFYCLLLLWLL